MAKLELSEIMQSLSPEDKAKLSKKLAEEQGPISPIEADSFSEGLKTGSGHKSEAAKVFSPLEINIPTDRTPAKITDIVTEPGKSAQDFVNSNELLDAIQQKVIYNSQTKSSAAAAQELEDLGM